MSKALQSCRVKHHGCPQHTHHRIQTLPHLRLHFLDMLLNRLLPIPQGRRTPGYRAPGQIPPTTGWCIRRYNWIRVSDSDQWVHCILPSKWSVGNLFAAHIGIPVFLILYFGHRAVFWRDSWVWRPEEVDLQAGLGEILAAERPPPVRDVWRKKLMIVTD